MSCLCKTNAWGNEERRTQELQELQNGSICITFYLIVVMSANIAEGFKKRGPSDKTRFLNVAQGSLEECLYYLISVQELGYGSTVDMQVLFEGVQAPLSLRQRHRVQSAKHPGILQLL
jgi:hypothetical protein